MSKKNGHRKLATLEPVVVDQLGDHPGFPEQSDAADYGIRVGLADALPSPPSQKTAAPPHFSAADKLKYLPPNDAATISLPIDDSADRTGYQRKFYKVELRLADKELAATFQRLFYALHNRDIRLAGGRHIDTASDVLRYLLEQYAATDG